MQDKINEAFDKTQKLLKEKNDDIGQLPESVATFLLVYASQGVIDNGGYRYFFESNWPQAPTYSRFVDAYSAIGCEAQAATLARVVETFPFENPHLDEDGRNAYVAANYDEDTCEVKGWGDALCGDESVWVKLEAFYTEHISDFES